MRAAPLSPRERVAVILALGVVLSALGLLRHLHLLRTSFWGHDSRLFGGAFLLQLGAIGAGIVTLQWLPECWARPLLILEGAICLFSYGWPSAACHAAGLLCYYAAVEVPLPRRLRPWLSVALIAALGIFGAVTGSKTAYRFSMLFCPRLLLYAWEKHQDDYPKGSLRDYLLYVLSPPLLLLPPYMVIIPFYKHHAARLQPRLTTDRAWTAFRHLLLGLLLVPVVSAMQSVGPEGITPPLFVYWVYVAQVLGIVCVARIAHGLLLLHGMEDRPPVHAPLLARDYIDLWHRFQVHQKDLQLAMFYYPVLLRLRRRGRRLATIAAVLWTLFIGNTLLHIGVRYIYAWRYWLPGWRATLFLRLVMAVVLLGTIFVQERRAHRKPVPGETVSRAWVMVRWFLSFTFAAWLMSSPQIPGWLSRP